MRLKITHKTTYCYEQPVHYALQQLRLTPRTGNGQDVIAWTSTITGGHKQLSFEDKFANKVETVLIEDGAQHIEILSEGIVDVEDRGGVVGHHRGFAPLWLFRDATAMTTPGTAIRRLVRGLDATDSEVAQMHALSASILEHVRYDTGHTDSDTTAESALAAGHGVCQDHAHIMIACARLMGRPARYVSGYLLMDGLVEQDAAHAWCEVWLEGIGWIGFDVSNGICPDTRYVRVATGRDYTDAAPVRGLRQGSGGEELHVALQVQQ